MWKKYLLALLLGVLSFSSYAQFELFDDFEFYNLGPISSQASYWRSSSGIDGDGASVVNLEANSGSQSLYISGNEFDEILLLVLSTPTFGVYTMDFFTYVPAGKSGYFNMQAALTPDGMPWNQALMGGHVFFNCDGASGGLGMVSGEMDCSAFDQSFIYPEDQWFRITCIYDLDNQVWDMFIDEIQFVFDQPFAFGSQVFVELAAFDFYSVTANNEMYIDDVVLGSPQIGVQDFTTNKFSVYPNPVKDVLNIKSSTVIDNVVIYDFLGRVVLHQNPGTISPTINMTNLASGSYLVKVTIGDSSKTVKILK